MTTFGLLASTFLKAKRQAELIHRNDLAAVPLIEPIERQMHMFGKEMISRAARRRAPGVEIQKVASSPTAPHDEVWFPFNS
jgi:hypothetical protein